jgi:hypothetical protein
MREHPLLRTELQNRAFAARQLDRLGVNKQPIKPMGRPPRAVGGWKPQDLDADE